MAQDNSVDFLTLKVSTRVEDVKPNTKIGEKWRARFIALLKHYNKVGADITLEEQKCGRKC